MKVYVVLDCNSTVCGVFYTLTNAKKRLFELYNKKEIDFIRKSGDTYIYVWLPNHEDCYIQISYIEKKKLEAKK